MPELIGWCSSAVLLATLAAQIYKQWRAKSVQGVSKWLFAGQTTASLGFTTYSLFLRNWVFVVTNALLLVAGITGFAMTMVLRRRQRLAAKKATPSSPGEGGRGSMAA